ncbi:MAG: tetratricopeptide repeat protein [Rhodocyclaceae bacterium]|nr:tetratricopeptide repeat protein [Rhodocyclaceae bacterium]
MKRLVSILAVALLASGCANPLNRVTMDRYAQTCRDAEQNGRMEVAEEACRRALINVRIGNLGPELESQELYNLGRIKRQLGKHAEAEEIYRESLRIQESLPNPDQGKIGRRLAELSIVIGEQKKFKDAWPVLSRLMPISEGYSGHEREVVKAIFSKYADEYDKLRMPTEAELLRKKANAL